jgi:hypothetical protein
MRRLPVPAVAALTPGAYNVCPAVPSMIWSSAVVAAFVPSAMELS